MRKILIPLALALIAGSSGMAFAASTATPAAKPAAISSMATPQSIGGTVKAFDLKSHSLTLNNGIAYTLPSTFKDPGIKVGQKLTVQWKMNGKAYDATSVKLG
ncbi:DUF1344 domain-containing protein [Devosia psychrophila]|uniref:DUF1344 domain-containing protein n=1 Tax=Devosia psychrophila TaxID=728005 RepID=A0A0F5PYF9_9HYPH|nr:DUF1344 domain-containing protein [Devosia psychrophila]KKC33635.1 hypothetical protein WH91_07770 [Devosia psychrophila]SFC59755.1 Protein of unknown function [Devosia psychrophila]